MFFTFDIWGKAPTMGTQPPLEWPAEGRRGRAPSILISEHIIFSVYTAQFV